MGELAIATTSRVRDTFVFRRVAGDRYAHVGGTGRGEGWAGVVTLVPGDTTDTGALPCPGQVTTASADAPERRFGPYWSSFFALVRLSRDEVVAFGADEPVHRPDAAWVAAAEDAAALATDVSSAKRLADELELLHAVRDVALVPPGPVEEVGRQVLDHLATALSCEVGGLLLPDGDLLVHVDPATSLDPGLVRLALRGLLQRHEGQTACVQDARDSIEGSWLRSYLVRPMGEGTMAVFAHTEDAPRGFTELCQHVATAATSAGATVLRAAQHDDQVQQRTTDGTPTAPATRADTVQPVVGDILRTLLQLPSDALDAGIRQALGLLGRALAVDRTYVFSIDATTCSNTHEWCAPGITPEIDNCQDLPLTLIDGWRVAFDAGTSVHVDDVDALPDAQADLRQVLQAQDIRSLLVVPMLVHGEVVGFVGFDAVRSARSFDPVTCGLLRSLADVLAAAESRRRADQRVARAEARTAELLRHSRDHVFLVDEDGRVSWASASFRQLGLAPDELVGRRGARLTHPDDAAWVHELLAGWLRSDTSHDLLLPDHRATVNGRERWFSVIVRDARSRPGIEGLIVSAHDVTERRDQTERLRHRTLHDHLTGLPNRDLLKDRLAMALHRSGRDGTVVGVVFLGLDGFKVVNDSRSHAVGDQLLRQIADRLRHAVRRGETAARFGGDQFVVVVEAPTAARVRTAADRVARVFDNSFLVGGHPQTVSASFGLRIAERGEVDPDAILQDADTALFAAKARGRARLVVFEAGMRERAVRQDQVLRRLPGAIEQGRVQPHHQPIVDLATGTVVGAEALARWTDADLGAVPPAEFIPLAEQSGLIGALGTSILRAACAGAGSWPGHAYVSVNLSASQLDDPGLCLVVERVLEHAGLGPDRLVLEVTESLLMRDTARAADHLRRLRDLGVRVALDDFGTGHSSLAVLRDLPLDLLKIDRGFIARIHEDEASGRMVDGIVSLAEDLGLQTIAEGVETAAQADRLREAGCVLAQGWLFGRPAQVPSFTPHPAGPRLTPRAQRPTGWRGP